MISYRFAPDYIRYELPYNNDLIHILELHVSITTHPILENLIKTQRFLSTLAKISATSCSGGYRLNLMRFLGMLLSPTYQSIVEESKSGSSIELLNILFCVVDQGRYYDVFRDVNYLIVLKRVLPISSC